MARIALAASVVAFALAVSGCGGDSGSSSAEQTTTAETTTAQGASGASGTASGELEGEVGPGFEIEVKQNGEDAESVSAGTYTLKVEDKSDIHNFHLIGPGGVDEMVTEVPFKGEKTVTVPLEKGTYTYQCDPHASSGMKGTFEVT
jgi:plastocyanin